MWFRNAQLHVNENAGKVRRKCPRCSNEVEFQLLWNKSGLEVGIPVVSWFTDATVLSTHKQYHLGCPVCGYLEEINRDVAKGLIAEGADQ